MPNLAQIVSSRSQRQGASAASGMQYDRSARALDLGNLGATTVPDLSGNGIVVTQKTGIYASTDGVDDSLINVDLTAEGDDTYRITGRVRSSSTGTKHVGRRSTGSFSSISTTVDSANVWEPIITTITTSGLFEITLGKGYGGGAPLYSAADWSDIKVTRVSTGEVIARWQLNESGAASLDGYPAFDSSGNGYHGTHDGGAGGNGEGTILQTAGLDWNSTADPAFALVAEIDTSLGDGTDAFQFVFANAGTFNCVVDWGDGNTDTITTWDDAAWDHAYAAGGTYTITVTGDIGRLSFNGGGDVLKLTSINIGNAGFDVFGIQFLLYGAGNLSSFNWKLDALRNHRNFAVAWFSCSSLTSFPLLDTSSGEIFVNTWNGCSSLTDFPLLDTSSGKDFTGAWFNCSSLTSFPLLDTSSGEIFVNTWTICISLTDFPLLDTSSGKDFNKTWRGCSSLTDFPANFFDNWNPESLNNGVFNESWDGCSSLTPASVENILVSIDASGIYGTNDGTSGGTQLADNVIDIDYNGAGLTGATTTAITSLKGKNWGITINGVVQ